MSGLMMDKYELLFSLVDDFDESDVAAIRELIGVMRSGREWFLDGPAFVDNIDSTSCTQPGDEPIRTVGGYLVIYKPSSPPNPLVERAELADVEYLIGKLAAFSQKRNCELELELGGKYVGDICNGKIELLPNRRTESAAI